LKASSVDEREQNSKSRGVEVVEVSNPNLDNTERYEWHKEGDERCCPNWND
jgi:hypothetical protein